jgi:hypothetical protein
MCEVGVDLIQSDLANVLPYPAGLLDVLCTLAPSSLANTGDKVVAALWAYFHSPPVEDGMLPAKDMLKAFRAAK